MRRYEKHSGLLGILLIAYAAAIVLSAFGYTGKITLWQITLLIPLTIWAVRGVIRRSFAGAIFPLAILLVVFKEQLGLDKLSGWTIIFAAILLVIGLNMIFSGKRRRTTFGFEQNGCSNRNPHTSHVTETITAEPGMGKTLKLDYSFGTHVNYVHFDQFASGTIDHCFGSLTVYLERVNFAGREAELFVDNCFGSTTIYIPKEWQVVNHIENQFGSVKEHGRCEGTVDRVLHLTGDNSFGTVQIYYF